MIRMKWKLGNEIEYIHYIFGNVKVFLNDTIPWEQSLLQLQVETLTLKSIKNRVSAMIVCVATIYHSVYNTIFRIKNSIN